MALVRRHFIKKNINPHGLSQTRRERALQICCWHYETCWLAVSGWVQPRSGKVQFLICAFRANCVSTNTWVCLPLYVRLRLLRKAPLINSIPVILFRLEIFDPRTGRVTTHIHNNAIGLMRNATVRIIWIATGKPYHLKKLLRPNNYL